VSSKSKPKTLGLVAFLVLAMGAGATYFQYNAVQAKKAEVAALESSVPSQEELLSSLAASSAKLAEYKAKLDHLEGSVPDVAYIPTLMQELEQVGLGNNIKVIGVRPAPQQLMQPAKATQEGDQRPKKKEYEEIEIEIQGRGSYDDVKAFLDSLKTFPKVIAVKTVTMEPQRDTGSSATGQIEAKVSVVAYVFPFEFIPATPKSVATKAPSSTTLPNTAARPQNSANSSHGTPGTPQGSSRATASNVTETMKVARKGGQ
jgi:Tfp pilus assembly protein PilO